MQQQKRFCRQFVDVSAARRGYHTMIVVIVVVTISSRSYLETRTGLQNVTLKTTSVISKSVMT